MKPHEKKNFWSVRSVYSFKDTVNNYAIESINFFLMAARNFKSSFWSHF